MLLQLDSERIKRALRMNPLLADGSDGSGRARRPISIRCFFLPSPEDLRSLRVTLLPGDKLWSESIFFCCWWLSAKGEKQSDDIGVAVSGCEVERSGAGRSDSQTRRLGALVAVAARQTNLFKGQLCSLGRGAKSLTEAS